jgi:hypothetical protein
MIYPSMRDELEKISRLVIVRYLASRHGQQVMAKLPLERLPRAVRERIQQEQEKKADTAAQGPAGGLEHPRPYVPSSDLDTQGRLRTNDEPNSAPVYRRRKAPVRKKRKAPGESGPSTHFTPSDQASPNVPSNAPAHALDAFSVGGQSDMIHTSSARLRTIAKKRRMTPNWVSQKDANKGITEGGELASTEDQEIYHTGIKSKRQSSSVGGL